MSQDDLSDDPVAALSGIGLLLESLKYKDCIVLLPVTSKGSRQTLWDLLNTQRITLGQLGGLIYHLADLIDNVDNWKSKVPY